MKLLRLLLFTLTIAFFQFSAAAQDRESESALVGKVSLGPITTACSQFSVPEDEALAELALEEARNGWVDRAVEANISRAGPLFVTSNVLTFVSDETVGAPTFNFCGILDDAPEGLGLSVATQEETPGVAGFCSGDDLEKCLEEATVTAATLLEKDRNSLAPPIYIHWPVATSPPSTLGELVSHIRDYRVAFSPTIVDDLSEGESSVVTRSSNGLQPLVPPGASGSRAVQDFQEISSGIAGHVWFIGG